MTAIGIITGLAAEARIARRLSPLVVSGGALSGRTRDLIDQLIRDGAEALLSFGISGGLAPDLSPGDLVLATAVNGPTGRIIPTDPTWFSALSTELSQPRSGVFVGRDSMAVNRTEKQMLAEHGIAVDMESHLVAEAAERAGLPFMAIRTIADPYDRALPPAAQVGLKPDGSVALGAVLASIAKTPGQVPALLAVARDTKKAMRGLVVAADRLGRENIGRGIGGSRSRVL